MSSRWNASRTVGWHAGVKAVDVGPGGGGGDCAVDFPALRGRFVAVEAVRSTVIDQEMFAMKRLTCPPECRLRKPLLRCPCTWTCREWGGRGLGSGHQHGYREMQGRRRR